VKGVLQPVSRPRSTGPRSTAKIRIGVIGAGRNTIDHHIPKLLAIEGVTITTIANRSAQSAEEACKALGIEKVGP
jgi:predicted dehydrogenase